MSIAVYMSGDEKSYMESSRIMRLIDADELKQQDFQDFSNTDVFNAIDNCPTVEAVPVIYGHNITHINPADEFVCSECGAIYQDFIKCEIDDDTGDITYHECEFKYCPYCGAKIH